MIQFLNEYKKILHKYLKNKEFIHKIFRELKKLDKNIEDEYTSYKNQSAQ